MQDAVLYVRVSTVEQSQHGVSLQAQEERLRAYCAAMGLNVVRVIREEGVSGGKALHTRPGGQRLLRLLADGEANHVVSLKLDRLFRSTEDALKQTSAWDCAGVVLHLTDMGGGQNINSQSAMGRMMLTLLASFAEFEKNLIAERTSAALEYKKRNGSVYGHAPYGFSVGEGGKKLVRNDAEQRTLKYIFQWRKEGASLHTVSQRLNDLAVPAKKGGKWHAATVAHIVNNDLYREVPENLFPYQPPGKKEPAEKRFVGQIQGAVDDLGQNPV